MGANATRAAVLGQLELREVKHSDGRQGILLGLGELGCVLVHHDDGGATCALISKGVTVREYNFPPDLMDRLVEWAAGPLRQAEDPADQLGYCGACLVGRCKDCKGADACQCDHTAKVVPQ